MKKILLAALVFLGGCTSNKFVIDAHIDGAEGMIYLTDMTLRTLDSTQSEQGRFRFEGVVDSLTTNILIINEKNSNSITKHIFIEPGTIRVVGNTTLPDSIIASGTHANDASEAYWKRYDALRSKYTQSYTPVTIEERAAIDEQILELSIQTLEENHDNFFGAMLLYKVLAYELTGSEIMAHIERFPENIRHSPLLGVVKKQAQKRLHTEPGKRYIDIIQPTPEGVVAPLRYTIVAPKNKYVLLDFWASWCPPCLAEIPYMKEAYAKYHDKGFDIYAVSFDTDRERWMQSIEQHQLGWIHVSDLQRFNNKAATDYAVQSIPANFLINCSTGKIVAINLRKEALGEKLAELLP